MEANTKVPQVSHSETEEFNIDELRTKFAYYCKDYLEPLERGTPSKALEFSRKMLFEVGPKLHKEGQSKGDNMVRFDFCYEEAVNNVKSSDVKTVIISTFSENTYVENLHDGKLILSLKQATILAMDVFLRAIKFLYIDTQQYFLSPLCAAIFSKDSIGPMAACLRISETEVTVIINASTCSDGQHLEDSDMACAIAATICSTKRMSNKVARKQVIAKVVKLYAAKNKQYIAERFDVFSEYALGGVPPGLDVDTLVQQFNDFQAAAAARRIAQSLEKTLPDTVSTDTGMDKPAIPICVSSAEQPK